MVPGVDVFSFVISQTYKQCGDFINLNLIFSFYFLLVSFSFIPNLFRLMLTESDVTKDYVYIKQSACMKVH